MDDSTFFLAFFPGDPDRFHHLAVAHADCLAVDLGLDSLACDLLDILHRAVVSLVGVGVP